MPLKSNLKKLINQSPINFQFSIKAHKSITHERNITSLNKAEEFYHSIQPLVEEQKLSAVLLQFPYSFHYNNSNRKYLSDILLALKGLPLCVEFRNKEWMLKRVFEAMKQRNVGYVQADTPQLSNLPHISSTTTSEIGYIRFHGRNKANWWTGDNTSRYDYLYQEEELNLCLKRIEEIAEKTKKLLIAFNNHYKANAITNAITLYELLKDKTRHELIKIKTEQII